MDDDNKKELLESIEESVKRGVESEYKKQKSKETTFRVIEVLIVAVLLLTVVNNINTSFTDFKKKLSDVTKFETPAENHDLVLDDNGFLGYTAADFEEAIIGKASQQKILTVYNAQVSDVVQISKTGLANWKVFSKTQMLTYHGTANYFVDLGKLTSEDFVLDNEEKKLYIYLPEVELEPINIQSSDIQFGDVEKGLLAFGDLNMKPEDMAEIQTNAQVKMTEKLNEMNTIEDARRFAKLSVWEIYQPLVFSVSSEYMLIVEFR